MGGVNKQGDGRLTHNGSSLNEGSSEPEAGSGDVATSKAPILLEDFFYFYFSSSIRCLNLGSALFPYSVLR